MLLTNTINAATTIETILAGNACVCANELRCGSADSVQFADWQRAQRKAKRLHVRKLRASGYSGPGSMPSGSLRCLAHPITRLSLRSVFGCVAVS
jgi:hypothetical protein